eukprot:TRINITY_DN5982_c1_g2_i1.p1 TRINITY_DN5982_c1_g2~~TRINITY_DN5982_c1_g2_i1.p1  ORF type:complete len:137 (-),score=54.75 TRINITY_DN5982_c1_g2_i1:12-422(-)
MLLNAGGKLLGVVTCHIKQKSDETPIHLPRLNLSIPVTQLQPLFTFALHHDVKVLKELQCPAEAASLWRLGDVGTPSQSFFSDNNKPSKFKDFVNTLHEQPHNAILSPTPQQSPQQQQPSQQQQQPQQQQPQQQHQ